MVKKNSKYAITEIITTGLNFREDKIIHIATYLLTAGKVTKSFLSFINPERSLEPEWSRSVGLSSLELKNAPKFFEIGKNLLTLWENHILLSTNPRFTYVFIKNEFKNLGFAFNHSYAHIEMVIGKNDTAFEPGPNKAYEVTDRVINKMAENGEAIKTVKKNLSPRFYNTKDISNMPQTCGVYLLKNLADEILYVGKAIRIKDRLRQHFRNLNRKGFNIHRKVAQVEFVETHSELLALLLELNLIRLHRPELNKALRNDDYKFELRFLMKVNSRNEVRIVPINKETEGRVIKRFISRKSALAFVSGLIASGHLSTENLYFFGATKDQFALVENMNAENEYDHFHDLFDLISYVNPFFKGKYLIKEQTGSGYCLIKEGDFYGLSLKSQEAKSFVQFEKMCEYKFSYASALEIVINYAKNHDLLIRRFD